jgi:hypothetical protein
MLKLRSEVEFIFDELESWMFFCSYTADILLYVPLLRGYDSSHRWAWVSEF